MKHRDQSFHLQKRKFINIIWCYDDIDLELIIWYKCGKYKMPWKRKHEHLSTLSSAEHNSQPQVQEVYFGIGYYWYF